MIENRPSQEVQTNVYLINTVRSAQRSTRQAIYKEIIILATSKNRIFQKTRGELPYQKNNLSLSAKIPLHQTGSKNPIRRLKMQRSRPKLKRGESG